MFESDSKVIAVIDHAVWCLVCQNNGERAQAAFMEINMDGAIQFIATGLTREGHNDEKKLDQSRLMFEQMLKYSINKGVKVKICGSCADARGFKNIELIEGAEISTMAEFTQWVVESDKVISF